MKLFNRLKYNCDLEKRYKELLRRVDILEHNYRHMLYDIKRLEEENIETTNVLYELMENIRAIDHRIDILCCDKGEENGL